MSAVCPVRNSKGPWFVRRIQPDWRFPQFPYFSSATDPGVGFVRSPLSKAERESWILRIADYHPEKNKWLIAIIFILTIVFAFFVNKVGFDQDMMHMNYMPENLKKTEATLNKINAYSLRSVYLVTDGRNLEDALKRQESVHTDINALQQKNIIKRYSGVFQLLISDSLQKERIRFWNRYWTDKRKRTSWIISKKQEDRWASAHLLLIPLASC